MATSTDISQLFTPEAIQDPFPVYAAMRDKSPVMMAGGDFGGDSLACFTYDQVYGVLRDHETWSSAGFQVPPEEQEQRQQQAQQGGMPRIILIVDDPPRHTHLRRLINKSFAPTRIDSLEPTIQDIIDETLAAMPEGDVDMHRYYNIPLPVRMTSTLLGIPQENFRQFRRWTDVFFGSIELLPPEVKQKELGEMVEFFKLVLAKRRREPENDLFTALAQAEVNGQKLEDWEIVGGATILMAAGNETTTNLIGNMFNILVDRPELWQRIRDDRSLLPAVIDETVRFAAPVQNFWRVATLDTEIDGTPVKKGGRVLISYASANRDPKEFENPNEFDIDRDMHRHVGFGMGIHYCLGAPLARAEARLTLNTFLDRYSRIERGEKPSVRQLSFSLVLGWQELNMRFIP